MSGGLTPCRQLRPSSRREHARASNYSRFKLSNIQTIKHSHSRSRSSRSRSPSQSPESSRSKSGSLNRSWHTSERGSFSCGRRSSSPTPTSKLHNHTSDSKNRKCRSRTRSRSPTPRRSQSLTQESHQEKQRSEIFPISDSSKFAHGSLHKCT